MQGISLNKKTAIRIDNETKVVMQKVYLTRCWKERETEAERQREKKISPSSIKRGFVCSMDGRGRSPHSDAYHKNWWRRTLASCFFFFFFVFLFCYCCCCCRRRRRRRCDLSRLSVCLCVCVCVDGSITHCRSVGVALCARVFCSSSESSTPFSL